MSSAVPFDFTGFKQAFEAKDTDRWLAFFSEGAEWIEFRHNAPPRNPNRMVGRDQIGAFIARVAGANVQLAISDEVIGPERVAFCVTCTLGSGSRILEHVIIHHADGRIVRQVDVEAWD